jgi:hypothetical protein
MRKIFFCEIVTDCGEQSTLLSIQEIERVEILAFEFGVKK